MFSHFVTLEWSILTVFQWHIQGHPFILSRFFMGANTEGFGLRPPNYLGGGRAMGFTKYNY